MTVVIITLTLLAVFAILAAIFDRSPNPFEELLIRLDNQLEAEKDKLKKVQDELDQEQITSWVGNVVRAADQPVQKRCTACGDPLNIKNPRHNLLAPEECDVCTAAREKVKTTVTEFDAFMACPHCLTEDWHYLREARPRPATPLPEMRAQFGAYKKGMDTMTSGYIKYVRANADTLIEAFGYEMPVRVIMNDAAVEAHARTIQPVGMGLSLDSSQAIKYDHPDARTIRTCTSCKKEWAQK